MVSLLGGALKFTGHNVVEHAKIDSARKMTFVDQEPFPSSGIVDTIELYAGVGGNLLKVGIYRPQASSGCDYQLVEQIILSDIVLGENQVWLLKFRVWFSVMI